MNFATSILLTIAALITLATSNAYAGSGKAIIPWYSESGQHYWIQLTNITSHDINYTIEPYMEDGTTIFPDSSITRIGSCSNSQINAGVGKTCMLKFTSSTQHFGQIVITWKNKAGENDFYALMGNAVRNSTYLSFDVPINNGNPF